MKERTTARGLKRCVAGWAMVVVGVGVMGLSWWSRGEDWTVFAEGRGRQLSLSITSGVVQVQVINGWWVDPTFRGTPDPPPTGPWRLRTWAFNVQKQHRWWGWRWFRSVQAQGTNTFAAVPLWVIAVAAVGGGAWLARWGAKARRRAMENRCAGCGYSLAGLARGARCPECGEARTT